MALTINSNISSLRSQRRLAENGKELTRSFEQLSSGQRINKASDDAAGLAIADTLNAKGRIFSQGIRNLNDGISVVAIADAAISSLTDITIRLKELAEQSANGVYSATQRKALDNEGQALKKEFLRVTKTTTFNGLNLFDGSVQGLRLQAGVGVEGSLNSSLGGKKGTGEVQANGSVVLGNNPYDVVTGDFNGDGIVDIASALYGLSSIEVSIGKGDGTFVSSGRFDVGGYLKSLTTGDMNGDGILDLMAGSYTGDSTIAILLGRGNGTFQAMISAESGPDPYAVATGDFNGDGIQDIVSTNYGSSGSVSVLIGKGNGTFLTRTSFVAGPARSVVTGDFNGDGKTDFITGDYGNNTASIFLGRGNGTFNPRITIATANGPQSIKAADLNGDGVLDLVTADKGDGNVSRYLGRGDGTFTVGLVLTVSNAAESVSLGDVNGDGYIDIVAGGYEQDSLGIVLGKGDGTFSASTTYTSDYLRSVTLGDLNGDGVLDIVSAAASGVNEIFLGKTQDGVSSLIEFSLKTIADSRQAMSHFDNKLTQLSAQRGTLGAFQSRITTAANTLQSATENFKAAESRIRDADIAGVSANLNRQTILQQAAASVLAQANLQPQLALRLLQS